MKIKNKAALEQLGMWVGIGVSIGLLSGIARGNLWLYGGVGLAVGLFIGLLFYSQMRGGTDQSEGDDQNG